MIHQQCHTTIEPIDHTPTEIHDQSMEKHGRSSCILLEDSIGWILSLKEIEYGEDSRIKLIRMFDQDRSMVSTARLSDFRKHGRWINRGFGPEICLPFAYWIIERFSTSYFERHFANHARHSVNQLPVRP